MTRFTYLHRHGLPLHCSKVLNCCAFVKSVSLCYAMTLGCPMESNLGFLIALPTSAQWLTEEKRTAMKAMSTIPPYDCKLGSHTKNVIEVQGGQHSHWLQWQASSWAALKHLERSCFPAIGLHFSSVKSVFATCKNGQTRCALAELSYTMPTYSNLACSNPVGEQNST